MNKMKPFTTVAALAAAALIFLTGITAGCSGGSDSREVKVVKGPFHIKVHAIGNLRSTASTHLGCPIIRRMYRYTISFMAPEGKEVKAGDPVLSFDAKQLMDKWRVKRSELETARKELEKNRLVEHEKSEALVLQLAQAEVKKVKAKQLADRPEGLEASNEVKKYKMDLELSELKEGLTKSRIRNQGIGKKTRLSALESKVKRLENEVSTLQSAIGRMKVKAPKPGMVVYTANWRGEKKAVGDTTWMGEKIIELPDLTKMEVAAVVPEPQAGKVKEGLPVEIRLDSNPDKVYNGKIKSLGRIFRTKSWDQPSIVFDAVIDILDPNPELMRPGMAAGVDIIVSSKENVLQIPESAIVYHEKGTSVFKKSFMGKKRVPITIGTRSAGFVEVLQGLEENDRVIITAGANGEEK
ncbi:MAG: HlyD family efflux transporter periplasmic adaptor subunit [bacterium]|nr:HlyD family efflux transporter periplasmic adaptor subunit [bacterium]